MIVVLLLLVAIMNRITLHSESAHQMHTRELVFEPFDANAQRDKGVEPVLLRAKKELLEPDSKWYVSSSLGEVHPIGWCTVNCYEYLGFFTRT